MRKLLFCFGTRPEAIKMAPLINEASKFGFEPIVCLSGQHRDMIKPFLEFFNIKVHFNLDIMKANQSLSEMTSSILNATAKVLADVQPEYVVVQGDTTTTFASALAGFYQKIPVVHIEAGLRTNDIYSPFPEEANRKFVSQIAKYHFAPTEMTSENLLKEGIKENVFVTGNTSIDALKLASQIIKDEKLDLVFQEQHAFVDNSK
ncbi:MAG: UDP-N-acetylglucosamine 2-epimerase (non-hydrolyzing), partial [Bacteriovorax sp.]|nr:UDP-N-acetylglucosamine 2-epimerase (non-hydrolyzing) [Bacteriovorax sp.]